MSDVELQVKKLLDHDTSVAEMHRIKDFLLSKALSYSNDSISKELSIWEKDVDDWIYAHSQGLEFPYGVSSIIKILDLISLVDAESSL